MTTNKEKRLLRLIKTPAKVLTKARDLYVHSLIGCAGQVSYGTVMGCPTGQFSTATAAPRSRSLTSSRSATRSVSIKGLQHNPDRVESKPSAQKEDLGSSTSMANAVGVRNLIPRSFSLGVIGRIDEDKPYFDEFEEDALPVATEVNLVVNFDLPMKYGPRSGD
ncbi:hypothetical protein V2J09_021610 [Rumex salicifolius]